MTGKVLKKSDELDVSLIELESIPPGVMPVKLSTSPPMAGEPLRHRNRLDMETVWNVSTDRCVSGRLAGRLLLAGRNSPQTLRS